MRQFILSSSPPPFSPVPIFFCASSTAVGPSVVIEFSGIILFVSGLVGGRKEEIDSGKSTL